MQFVFIHHENPHENQPEGCIMSGLIIDYQSTFINFLMLN